ncbi:MAG: RNA 2',3'-cyclic phosphodiesterase [Dehalococcoidia bacterium]|jgi:2'-5' RNA ligase
MIDQQIRAFIAIELPAELRKRMGEFQAGLKGPQQKFVKWVNPGSVHLTLKFLGNVKEKQLDSIKKELQDIAKESRTFSIATSETGCFPNLKRARVFWLGLDGDIDQLLKLQGRIDEALSRMGFAKENRPFTAHLTLARLKEDCSMADRLEFAELVKDANFERPFSMKIEAVSLMRSQLTPAGAVYTQLAEFRLTVR